MNNHKNIGVSFSLHRCHELGLDKKALLRATLRELKFRRLRLMSYWNIHEQKPGIYDFTELDWQMDMAAKYGTKVTLCVGKRQPRWPECHMPDWATEMPTEKWRKALYKYVEIVVKRYKNHPALESWQLENEALLKEFGYCIDQDFSHERLQTELKLIKKLDKKHPVIMTLSDSWGFPFKNPRPDIYGASLYRITLNKNKHYAYSKRPARFYRYRANLIGALLNKPVFIHELQAEPWLPQDILSTPISEQLKYMNATLIKENLEYALNTGLYPIDLWGLEWWYWLKTVHHTPDPWNQVKELLTERQV